MADSWALFIHRKVKENMRELNHTIGHLITVFVSCRRVCWLAVRNMRDQAAPRGFVARGFDMREKGFEDERVRCELGHCKPGAQHGD